jgi:hypothetical protein
MTYVIVSIVSGVLFGVMDGLINANPFAIKLFEIYKPLARTSVNFVAGIIIDLAYGFILAALFLLFYSSLPGESGFVKGVSFALVIWFMRVAMNVASQWIMFNVPLKALLYILFSGLGEILIIGMLYGFFMHPAK